MRMLFALTAALVLAGCGQPAVTVTPRAAAPIQAQQATTVEIGAVDLRGQVVELTPQGHDLRVVVRPEGRTNLVTVLVDQSLRLRVVRGTRAGIDGLDLVQYLKVGFDVQVQLASPGRARAIFWDLTGVPM